MLPFQRLKSECFEPQIRLAFILGLGLTYETHFFVLRTHLLVSWREELLCSRNPSFVSKKTISMETFLGSKNPSLCFMEGRVVSKETTLYCVVAMSQKPIFCLQEDNLHGDISWFLGANFWLQGTWLHGDNFWFHGDNFWFKGNISLL